MEWLFATALFGNNSQPEICFRWHSGLYMCFILCAHFLALQFNLFGWGPNWLGRN